MDDNEEKKLDENKISKVLSSIPEQYHKTSFQARRTALDYMRSSNRKELLNQIGDWLDEVNVETDNIVDVYFQGFNKSIHNYSRILEFMGTSHVNALSMSKEVEEINKLINFNGIGIERLWKRNLEYYYMIEILEKMEELKKVPDLLNKYIKGNHFVHAANILVNSISALNERDLVNVNALMDLRQMLVEKKESFKDMLVEKLNDHIYLKTKSSLKAFEYDDENNLQSNFKKILLSNKNSNSNNSNNTSSTSKLPTTTSPFKPPFTGAFQTKASQEKAEKAAANLYNQERLSQSNQPEVLKLEEISKASNSKEDLNIDPEQDGKLFMTLLVEALNVLEYLSPAVGLILGRISIELKTAITNSTTLITNVYHSEGRIIPKMPGESSSSNSGNSGSNGMNGSGGITSNGSTSSSSSMGGNGLSPSVLSKNSHSGVVGSGGATFSNIDEYSAAFNFLTETFNRNDLLANQTHNIPLVDLLKMIFNKVNMVFKNHLQLSKIFNEAIRKSELKIRANKFDFKEDTESGDSDNDFDGTTPKPTILQKSKVEIADVYDASLVWEIIQKEIREMLRVHLQDTSSLLLSTKSRLNPDGTESNSGKSQRLFSFTNSIVTDNWNGSISPITSPTSPNGSAGGDGTESNNGVPSAISIFKASQYNVTPIYPMIVKFTDHLDKTLRDRTGSGATKTTSTNSNNNHHNSKKGLLRLYIDDFVHRNFLQHIKNDYKDRFAHSIESTEAFKPLERYKLVFRLKETKPILNSTLQIFQFVIELFSDIVAMSHYVVEFGAIIQVSLLRYYEKCLSKFSQEIDPTLTNQLLNTDLYKYLLASLAVSSKKQDVAKFQDSREEEYEFKLESDLFNHPEKPVLKNQLILNIEKLTMLANMSHSLNWLADKIVQLLIVQDDQKEKYTQQYQQQQQQQQQQQYQQVDSNIKTPSKLNSGGSIPSTSGGNKENNSTTTSTGSNNFIGTFNQMSTESIEALKTMEEPIKDIAQRFKDLAKRCLLALRIEYRIHCFYFLEGFKRAQYMCEEERTDPDSFIVELNKDLSASEEMMSIYLTSDKCNFLFSGIAKLIGKLLISKLVHVNSINDNGVAKLCKNVFTLQQNLSNIIVKREIFFDRIRQFYQALSAEDELLNYLLEKMSQPFFSLEEGKIIIDFLQRTKRISPNAISTLEAKYKNM
ncbi:hypothetical protein ACTFIV_004046 [Dictyostelium citrinum]